MKDIKTIYINGEKWLAISNVARKVGKDRTTVIRAAQKCSCAVNAYEVKTKAGTRVQKFMRESDLLKIIAELRPVGEYAESIEQIQTVVINKGIEQVQQLEQPKRVIKPFQRFPEPIQIPEKPIRACINEYIRMVFKVTNTPCNVLFNQLYTQFKYRFGIDPLRHSGYTSAIEKINDMEKLPELYALAREMFDSLLPETDMPKLEA